MRGPDAGGLFPTAETVVRWLNALPKLHSQNMQIGRVASIAISGLRTETARLSQSAQNVANVNTDGYEPQRVLAQEQASGGVRAVTAPTYGANGRTTESAADALAPSKTDLAEEQVAQLSSLHAYKANVAVLRTSDEMLGELVRQKA